MSESEHNAGIKLSVDALTNIVTLCCLIGECIPEEMRTKQVERGLSTIKGISLSVRESVVERRLRRQKSYSCTG